MLVYELKKIGNKLLNYRKKAGLTQSQVAEMADLSDRTYADIERGNANMRIDTMLRICDVLRISPDDIFYEDTADWLNMKDEIVGRLEKCPARSRETALRLLSVYIESISGAPPSSEEIIKKDQS